MYQRVILLLLVLTAFFFRSYLIPQNLFFGPEHGVDFNVIKQIVYDHHFTLIGPKTDIGGIYHGPLYYYLASIPEFLSGGNPFYVMIFFILIQSSSVILFYFLASELFNKRTGWYAAILFTVSFGAVVAARWLSSQPLSIPLFCLFFLFLVRFIKGNNKNLFFAAIFAGLLGQVEFMNFLYIGVFLLFIIFFFRNRFKKLSIIDAIITIVLLVCSSILTFILFDLRHSFLISKSIFGLLSGKSSYHLPYINSLFQTIMQFFAVYSDVLFSVFVPVGVFCAIASFVIPYIYKRHVSLLFILYLWLLIPVALLVVLRYASLYQLFLALIPGMILLTSRFLDLIEQKYVWSGSLLLFFLVIANIFAIFLFLPQNKDVFFQTTQPDLRYSDEQNVINWMYTHSQGKTFSYQAYTIPYWSPEGWEYLFWYFGTHSFHFVPSYDNQSAEHMFIIVQDDLGNIQYQQGWLKSLQNSSTTLIKLKRFGILTLWEEQKR